MMEHGLEEPAPNTEMPAAVRVKVIGIGGAGNNVVDRLMLLDLKQVELANINTDVLVLQRSVVAEKLMIGRKVTKGLSAGGDVGIGLEAGRSDQVLLEQMVEGVDLVFLVTGLGGGTGSAVTSLMAKVAEEKGAVVIAFAAMPFLSEGKRRGDIATEALIELRENCHAVIALPNDLLRQEVDEDATLLSAFKIADEWISRGIRAFWSIIFDEGMVNVDFANLRNAFWSRGGKTLFGLGFGEGEESVEKALKSLETCPLLHLPENKYLQKADSVILNVVGGPEMKMAAASRIMEYVSERFRCHENLVWGAVVDPAMSGKIEIVVVGTIHLERSERNRRKEAGSAWADSRSTESVEGELGETLSFVDSTIEKEKETSMQGWKIKGRSTRKMTAKEIAQNEFDFPGEADVRGLFDTSEKNLHEGIDLDIPTYFRRGIRIHVT